MIDLIAGFLLGAIVFGGAFVIVVPGIREDAYDAGMVDGVNAAIQAAVGKR